MMRRPPTSRRALGSPPIRTLRPPAWITPVSLTEPSSRPGERPSADVVAELHSLEPDSPHGVIGPLDGRPDVSPERLHAQDSPARGEESAVAERGAGMEDIDARKRGRRLHALDGKPGAWGPGIARGGEHDADGSLAPPAQGGGQPAPGSHGLEDGKDVLVEAGQDGLTLGIAEAAIELHDTRAVGTAHEADEEHARVRRALPRHGRQRGP